eukprot:comp22925_c0_seq1/m.36300 comp22925_c0_seq1/g.36300  ORF comp22925_c0_seq1/g.36300 comp22925_c0_seq1/m.36300 type:complete len:224 (-) comp22925_c0_seq1:242-913(-)
MTQDNKPVFAYWAIRGLAQPIKLLFAYAHQDFEDKRYVAGEAPDYDLFQWLGDKEKLSQEMDFPNLPYLIDGDVKISESNAILRHVARKYKPETLGKDLATQARVDEMIDVAYTFRNSIVGLVYNPRYQELKGDYEAGLPKRLGSFERALHKDYFCADYPTAPDFVFYELLDQVSLMFPGCLDKYPKVKDFHRRVAEIPEVAEYLASPENIVRPINNTMAMFK